MAKERKVLPKEDTVIVYTSAAEAKKIAKAGTEDTVHAVLAESLVKKGFAELKSKASGSKKITGSEEK